MGLAAERGTSEAGWTSRVARADSANRKWGPRKRAQGPPLSGERGPRRADRQEWVL